MRRPAGLDGRHRSRFVGIYSSPLDLKWGRLAGNSSVIFRWQANGIARASKSAGRDGVLCPQAVSDDQGPDQGKGKKSQADARAADVLGENGTELGAQGRAGMHHQGDEHVDVALERMGDRPEAGGDDHFEQVRADGDAGGDAQNINHRRHAYVTRASPEKTTEKTADE